jgi:predicted ATPase
MLSDLHIRNFRGFEDLRLDNLGRVNLVVGKNNTGKTSLLEAVTILADPRQMGSLPHLFRDPPGDVVERYYKWLRKDGSDPEQSAIESTVGNERLRVSLYPGKYLTHEIQLKLRNFYNDAVEIIRVPTKISWNVRSVAVQDRNGRDIVSAYSRAVAPKGGEERIESLLRAVDPRIQTVRLATDGQNTLFVVVDIGLGERVPLPQLGQGVCRLLGVFAEILGHSPQIVLVDEIENGIHYTAMPQVWKGIAEVAERMNVQIFATTHSHECLEAAHEAFAERASYDFRVVQLYRVGQKTDGRVLDRKLIEAALAGEIDLR